MSNLKEKSLFSPAKVNLFLAITGVRNDGFHNLISLVAKLKFGDEMVVRLTDEGQDELVCDNKEVPCGDENLIMKALQGFQKVYPFYEKVSINLKKRIPIGGGLGGGSSNGAVFLKALNELLGNPLGKEALGLVASKIGSDCSLFLEEGPIIMRGRGEVVERVSENVKNKLIGQKILIVVPPFSINTAWAYGQMKKNPTIYLKEQKAEEMLKSAMGNINQLNLNFLQFNNFEQVIFKKFRIYGIFIEQVKRELGLKCSLSGSGSACYVIYKDSLIIKQLQRIITKIFGSEIFMVETELE